MDDPGCWMGSVLMSEFPPFHLPTNFPNYLLSCLMVSYPHFSNRADHQNLLTSLLKIQIPGFHLRTVVSFSEAGAQTITLKFL